MWYEFAEIAMYGTPRKCFLAIFVNSRQLSSSARTFAAIRSNRLVQGPLPTETERNGRDMASNKEEVPTNSVKLAADAEAIEGFDRSPLPRVGIGFHPRHVW